VAWFSGDDDLPTPTAETVETVADSARILAAAGALVEERRAPDLGHAVDITQRYWRMADLTGKEIERLLLDWDGFRTTMLRFIEHVDLILCPVAARPAEPSGTGASADDYCLASSLTGYPSAVVRAGTSPEGLPIGVQLVARPWREDVALAAARHVETALDGWQPPPLWLSWPSRPPP
jgi:amidase